MMYEIDAFFAIVVVMTVLLECSVTIFAGSAELTEPPASKPYPANAKFSLSVSLRVGKALAALPADPPKVVDCDRQRFSLLV